ncbi:hypothetical protein [Lapillicoccus sp.]|uniref:hypothetical protein n=1 Tax=Lapillicoccus sp. TaxID=1909287 RepID=UPI0039832A7E
MRALTTIGVIATLLVAAAAGTTSAAGAGATASTVAAITTGGSTGAYYRVAPSRILDTRQGAGQLGPGAVLPLQVGGQGGVPGTGVSAVVLNVTVTNPTAGSYLTAYPSDLPRPNASSINFPRGFTGANLVTVPLHAGGVVNIYNAFGSVDVIGDVVGFYAADESLVSAYGASGGFIATVPTRLYDSRNDASAGNAPFVDGEFLTLPVRLGPDPNGVDVTNKIRATVVNITVASPTAGGFVRTWDGAAAEPGTSTVNFAAGTNVANTSIVPTAPCTVCGGSSDPSFQLKVYTGGSAHVIVDLVGVTLDPTYTADWRFKPVATPQRIVDSRLALGINRLGEAQPQTFVVPSTVAGPNTMAIVSNLTAVTPSAATYLQLWAAGDPVPDVSNLNLGIGQVVANAAYVPVGASNNITIQNRFGQTDAIVDVAGTMEYVTPAITGKAPAIAGASGAQAARTPVGVSPAAPTRGR